MSVSYIEDAEFTGQTHISQLRFWLHDACDFFRHGWDRILSSVWERAKVFGLRFPWLFVGVKLFSPVPQWLLLDHAPTYPPACMHGCMHACNLFIHTCTQVCMHANACTYTNTRACVHACMHAYIRTYVHTYMTSCIKIALHYITIAST